MGKPDTTLRLLKALRRKFKRDLDYHNHDRGTVEEYNYNCGVFNGFMQAMETVERLERIFKDVQGIVDQAN